MGILCITNKETPNDIKSLLNDNHRLYAHIQKQDIEYTSSLYDGIDFICNQPECIIISEFCVFINPIVDYRLFTDNHYLYLISRGKPHSIANIYNQIFITVASEWTKLFLRDWHRYNVPILDYISMHISLDTTTELELQNIKLLTSPISLSIEDINKYNRIPPNLLLTDAYNISTDVMRQNIIGINKYLGIYYANI